MQIILDWRMRLDPVEIEGKITEETESKVGAT